MGRFVDLVMGAGACAPKKLESGNPLVVLGVQAEVNLAGVVFTPSPAKIKEWVAQIKLYLRLGLLTRGEASKLAGRLGFAAQHVFNRLGRALLVPLYRHMNARSSKIGPELEMALVWWCTTLEASMCEVVQLRVSLVLFATVALPFLFFQVRTWRHIETAPVQLLCDARCGFTFVC